MDRQDSNGDPFGKANDFEDPETPSPDNFEEFFPWACKMLGVEQDVIIIRELSTNGTEKKDKNAAKEKPKQQSSNVGGSSEEEKSSSQVNIYEHKNTIKIIIVCDNSGNVLQLKFNKNKFIPRIVFKILGLILEYHVNMTNITINKGLEKVTVYELNKLLTSTITDICLDDTYIDDANYDLLLENSNSLTNLSLCRCKIDDEIVRKIAEKLAHPLPAAFTLSLLNLASNRITNEGAKYIAQTLKSNRRLVYLNLADNSISDDGSLAILNVLDEFIVSCDELKASRYRYIQYWKMKNEVQVAGDQADALERADNVGKVKKVKGKAIIANIGEKVKIVKREAVSDEFNDPFAPQNIREKGGLVYCYGNNYLAYLNLSYNDISYLTIKKLLHVLVRQKFSGRKPRGIINVCLEGNSIPEFCVELFQINDILQSSLVNTATGLSARRKSKPLTN